MNSLDNSLADYWREKYLAERRARIQDRAYANARYSELLKAHRELLATVKPRAHTAKRDTPAQDVPDLASMTEDQRIQWFRTVKVKG